MTDPEHPTIPPSCPAGQGSRSKVIDLARAVGTIATAPVLDVVKRRMYRDWLVRRLRPRQLRFVYRSHPLLSVDEIDDILREESRKEAA